MLPLIIKNVYIYHNTINNIGDSDDDFPTIKIYSNSFMTYQQEDFNEKGYILYKLSQSVWFGTGNVHTNTIEGVWSAIKRIINNFNGLNGSIYNKFQNKEIEFTNYVNGCICTQYFIWRVNILN